MALNLVNCFFSKNVYKYSQRLQCINSCWRNITSIDKDIKHNSLQNGTFSKLKEGPSLHHFISNPNLYKSSTNNENKTENHPYIQDADVNGRGRKVFIKTYGCQMNFNDTEIVWSILKKNGFVLTDNMQESDVILLMTCAIREGAETKIWNKLEHLRAMKQKRENNPLKSPLKIGILGCMAERLKHKLIEKEKMVDLVAGPDSYRDLPRMLALTESGQSAINVLLSLDETYADVIPVQMNQNSRSAFVSIMRGCDNMCSYCIVPFTRGRERSRPIDSIVDEVKILSDKGIKEITLLGQNVNSYLDKSQESHVIGSLSKDEATHLSKGFKTVYRPKKGGLRFADLLDKVSLVNPEMRIRFTSPHPKDFPDEVLYLIRDRPNICNQVHLPAQSGNSRILDLMGRGYTRESYLELVDHIRTILPVVALNSDFICGFCSETEEEFQDTLSLIRAVKYNFAYVFSYSMREKTRAFHRFKDDVPHEVKLNRLERLSATFREEALFLNKQQIGSTQLILIEGESRRSQHYLSGRNDGNTKVIIPKEEVKTNSIENTKRRIEVGDYVVTKIMDATSQVLKGIPLYHSSIYEFAKQNHHQPTTKISCISNG